MALLVHDTITIKTQADGAQSLHTTAHATLHTLGFSCSPGATGSLQVKVRPIGGDLENLLSNSSPVVINLADIVSPVFMGCISEVEITPVLVVGTYNATLSSQGSLPQD